MSPPHASAHRNANGLLPRAKAARDLDGFKAVLEAEKPDIIALQEVRVFAHTNAGDLHTPFNSLSLCPGTS